MVGTINGRDLMVDRYAETFGVTTSFPTECSGADMARVLYTAEATVTGGRANGHG